MNQSIVIYLVLKKVTLKINNILDFNKGFIPILKKKTQRARIEK